MSNVGMIIGCVPARDEDRHGISWEPSPNCTYEQSTCSECGIPVMLGLRQKELHRKHGYPIMCMDCIIKLHPDVGEGALCTLSRMN